MGDGHDLNEDQVAVLVEMTDKFSFSDLTEFCKDVEKLPRSEVVERYTDEEQGLIVGISVEEFDREVKERTLTFADYKSILEEHSPTADEETIRAIEEFHTRYERSD